MTNSFEEKVIAAIAELRTELRTEMKNMIHRFQALESRFEKLENKVDQRVLKNGSQDQEIVSLRERLQFLEDQQKARLRVTLAWATAVISAIATVASVLIQNWVF